MKVPRWLGAVACLCWLAIPALADPTVQDFSNPGATGTNYAEYPVGQPFAPYACSGCGPASAFNFYRFTQSGVGGTQNQIAFDLTAPGPTGHVVANFDFRIGGTPVGTDHADGLGLCLMRTDLFGKTGNGASISEEGASNRGAGIGIGLDTYNNAAPYDIGNPNLPQSGSAADHISVNMRYDGFTGGPTYDLVFALDLYSLTNNGYNLHQDNILDDTTPFDHCRFTVDFQAGGGALVNVFITSAQGDSTGGVEFQALKDILVPYIQAYEMRIGFGARTGGATDTHDIANINIQFSPP